MSWDVFNLEEDEELAELSPTLKARIWLSLNESPPSKDDIADLGPSPLYFAYGRNLNPAKMAERNVNFTRRRAAEAKDWKLTFFKVGGYATMVPCPGSTVHGVLYDVDPGGILELDGHEGVASRHYSRERIRVTCAEEDLEVVVYLATPEMTRNGIKPSAAYLEDLLCDGSRELLPPDYHAWLARSPTREDHEDSVRACSHGEGLVRVFTYGTLMRGFHNHKYLEGADFISDAVTCEAYTMLSERIPYVDASIYPPAGRIHGEVYAVDSEQLSNLDRLEGHPNWYHRDPVEVELDCEPFELPLDPAAGEATETAEEDEAEKMPVAEPAVAEENESKFVTRVLDPEDDLDFWLWKKQSPKKRAPPAGTEEATEVMVEDQILDMASVRQVIDVEGLEADLDKWLRQKQALSGNAPAAEGEEELEPVAGEAAVHAEENGAEEIAAAEQEEKPEKAAKARMRVWAFIYFNEVGMGEVMQSGRFADRGQ